MSLADLLEHEVAKAGVRIPLPVVYAVYSRGITASENSSDSDAQALARVREFLTAAAARTPETTRDADLMPALPPTTQLERTFNIAERYADKRVADLLLASAAQVPGTPQHVFTLNRALKAATRHGDPRVRAGLTAAVRALLADGNSTIARSLRARAQLRDRKGRWIEMGGGVRFKVRMPGMPGGGQWFHGRVEGVDVPNGLVSVRLEDGRLVSVPNDKLEQPAAILNLPGQPLVPNTDPSEFDPNAPTLARLKEVPSPVNRVAGGAPSVTDLRDAAHDAGQQFLRRIPNNSTERATAEQVVQSLDNSLTGDLQPADVQERVSNISLFARTRADRNRGAEAEQWRAFSEDLDNVGAAAAPDHPDAQVARIPDRQQPQLQQPPIDPAEVQRREAAANDLFPRAAQAAQNIRSDMRDAGIGDLNRQPSLVTGLVQQVQMQEIRSGRRFDGNSVSFQGRDIPVDAEDIRAISDYMQALEDHQVASNAVLHRNNPNPTPEHEGRQQGRNRALINLENSLREDRLDTAAPDAPATGTPAGVTRGGRDADGNRLPDSDGVVRLGPGDSARVGGGSSPEDARDRGSVIDSPQDNAAYGPPAQPGEYTVAPNRATPAPFAFDNFLQNYDGANDTVARDLAAKVANQDTDGWDVSPEAANARAGVAAWTSNVAHDPHVGEINVGRDRFGEGDNVPAANPDAVHALIPEDKRNIASFYEDLDRYINDPSQMEGQVNPASMFLRMLASAGPSNNYVAYRGMNVDTAWNEAHDGQMLADSFQPGSEVSLNPASWSTDETTARRFALGAQFNRPGAENPQNRVVFMIASREPLSGLSIQDMSAAGNGQSEFVPAVGRFRVGQVDQLNGYTRVELQPVAADNAAPSAPAVPAARVPAASAADPFEPSSADRLEEVAPDFENIDDTEIGNIGRTLNQIAGDLRDGNYDTPSTAAGDVDAVISAIEDKYRDEGVPFSIQPALDELNQIVQDLRRPAAPERPRPAVRTMPGDVTPADVRPPDAPDAPQDPQDIAAAAADVIENLPGVRDSFEDLVNRLRFQADAPDSGFGEWAAGYARGFELLARPDNPDGEAFAEAARQMQLVAEAFPPPTPEPRDPNAWDPWAGDAPPAPAPAAPDVQMPEDTQQNNPEVRDHLGGDVPVGFTVATDPAPGVQRYTHHGEDGENYTVDVGGTNDDPHYVIRRGAQGELVDDVPDWDGVLEHFMNANAAAPQNEDSRLQREVQHQDRVDRNVDDQERPLPTGWTRDQTSDGETVYRGPNDYSVLNDGENLAVMRRENGQFVQVGSFPDWAGVEQAVNEDRNNRAVATREDLANWMSQNGFSPADVDAARMVPNAEEMRAEIMRSQRAQQLQMPGQYPREQFALERRLNAALDLPGEDGPANEAPEAANRRRIVSELQNVAGISDETAARVNAAPTINDIQQALNEDPSYQQYAQRMAGLMDLDRPQPHDREAIRQYRSIMDRVRGAGDLPGWSPDAAAPAGQSSDTPDVPSPSGIPATPEPANAPDAPEAPAAPAAPAAAGEQVQGVPRPRGAPPDRRRFHDRLGVISDPFGRPIYRGVLVQAMGRGDQIGEVVRVQEDTGYAEIRFPDGRILGRSRNRLRVLPDAEAAAHRAGGPEARQPVNVVNAPAAPAAPAAPNAPNAPAAQPIDVPAAQSEIREILDMHQRGAAQGFPLLDGVGDARAALQIVTQPGATRDQIRQALERAVAGYDRELNGNRLRGGSPYWNDITVRRQRANDLLQRVSVPPVNIPAVRDELTRMRAGIPRAQRAAGGIARWRAGFALQDGIDRLAANDVPGALPHIDRAIERLNGAGPRYRDEANRLQEFRDQLSNADGAAPAAEAPAPNQVRGPGFMPEDFIAPRVENPGKAAPIGRSGDTPNINDPRSQAAPPANAANPNAVQADYSPWGPRAAEIAQAARTRGSFESLRDLRGAELEDAVRQVFGSDDHGVEFGSSGYRIRLKTASPIGSGVSAQFTVHDANGRQVGKTSRTLTFAPNGKHTAYNALMQLDGAAQGSGFASAFNRYMENWYVANGFDNVTVSAGLDSGGFVWALNGFGWKGRPRESASSMLRNISRAANTEQERQQVRHMEARIAAGDTPTPMELALIGWSPTLGKNDQWAGKRGMKGQSWSGIKHLKPNDKNQVQRQNYDLAAQARGRVERGENVADVSPDFVIRMRNGSIEGADAAGLSRDDLNQIAQVLSNRQSLAAVPFRQKRALAAFTNSRLVAGDPDVDSLLALRTAVNNELRADYPDPPDLGVGEALRDVRFQDVVDDNVPGFKVSRPDNGMGVNATYKVTHVASGQVFFFKRETWGKASVEHDVVHMLRNSGWHGYGAYGMSRVPGQDDIVIQQRAGDSLDLPKRPTDARAIHDDYRNAQYGNYEDPLRMILLDAVIGNGDRHSGNFQLAKGADGRWWLFPIDHGLADVHRGDAARYNASRRLNSRSRYNRFLRQIMGARATNGDALRADILRIIGEYRTGLSAGGYADPAFVQVVNAQLDNLEANINDVVTGVVAGGGVGSF